MDHISPPNLGCSEYRLCFIDSNQLMAKGDHVTYNTIIATYCTLMVFVEEQTSYTTLYCVIILILKCIAII